MKKGLAILLTGILVIDLTSCTSYMQLTTQEDFEKYQNNDHIRVLTIHSKKDSIIVFNEKFPGKLKNRQVYGLRQRQFPYNTSDSIIFTSQDQNAAFIRNNGVLYKIVSQDKTGFVCISPDTIRTPFSDVTQMKITKTDPLKTSLMIFGVSGVFAGVLYYLLSTQVIYSGGFLGF